MTLTPGQVVTIVLATGRTTVFTATSGFETFVTMVERIAGGGGDSGSSAAIALRIERWVGVALAGVGVMVGALLVL